MKIFNWWTANIWVGCGVCWVTAGTVTGIVEGIFAGVACVGLGAVQMWILQQNKDQDEDSDT